jgi:hypothetical protein
MGGFFFFGQAKLVSLRPKKGSVAQLDRATAF